MKIKSVYECRKANGISRKRLRAVCEEDGGYIEHLFRQSRRVNIAAFCFERGYLYFVATYEVLDRCVCIIYYLLVLIVLQTSADCINVA